MKLFCDNYSLKSLIIQPTCYKDFEKPTCVDLISTNMPRSFQNTFVLEAWLSVFHLVTRTTMRKHFRKIKSRTINVCLVS